MTRLNPIHNDNGFICKDCRKVFSLGRSASLIFGEGLTFPNGDISKIRAPCPNCNFVWTYDNSEMLVPTELLAKIQPDSDELQKRVSQLENRIGELVAETKEKDQIIRTKDEQMGELLKANSKLADGVDRLTQKLIEGDSNNPNKKSTIPPKTTPLGDGMG